VRDILSKKFKNKAPKSIKRDLIVALSTLIGATLIVVYLISFFETRAEINEVFDANLVKSSKLIFSLVKNEIVEEEDDNFAMSSDSELEQKIFHRYEYRIHSQAWRDGQLIYTSDNNFSVPKPDYDGFEDIQIEKTNWRGFSFYDEKTHIRILVLEKHEIRNKLSIEILFSLIIPLLISFIPLFLIIIATVKTKMRALDRIAIKVEKMSSKSLEQFRDNSVPLELKPFVKSFNKLIFKLSESMEAERRFTDYAAHELKTPLTAIKIQAQLLAKNKNKDKEKEYLENLIEGINRAAHMINQLLTLSRLEPENKNIEKEKFELSDLINSLLPYYREKAAAKNLEIIFLEKKFAIEANKFYIEILLRNLIDNAIKYSSVGGEINIELSAKKLRISNSGAEISAEDQTKIFDKFYRINRANTENEMSCGLGLSIVKKIVELHNGAVFFTSVKGINSVVVEL
jgi:two-component system sensor histidine kinase QseC